MFLVASGCVPTWTEEPVQPQRTLVEGPIRVNRTDATVVMLRAPVTIGDTVVGIALNDPYRRIAIPLSEVATIEIQGSRKATAGEVARGYLMYVTGVMVVGTVLITIVLLK